MFTTAVAIEWRHFYTNLSGLSFFIVLGVVRKLFLQKRDGREEKYKYNIVSMFCTGVHMATDFVPLAQWSRIV